MAVAAGTHVDHYRIERPVGSGAFATVYLASDDRFDASVALKVLAENRSLDVEARRRFVEEAQKLRAVRSPSVVTVFDVGETGSHQPYMVLEYADRGDLAARRSTPGVTVTAADVTAATAFLEDALSALHRRGLVHRDVKPQNVLIASAPGETGTGSGGGLLADDERLLLGDLGFVKDLEAASGFTVGGGTAAFRAPEQDSPIGTVDQRADIYAASAMLVWLVTGATPRPGERWADLLARAAAGSALPPGAATAIAEGLRPEPDTRPPDMTTWATPILTALAPSPAVGTPVPAAALAGGASDPATAVGGGNGGRPVGVAGRGRGWRRVVVLAAVVAAGLVVAVGGLVGLGAVGVGPLADAGPMVVDGEAITEQTVGGLRVAIIGPAEIVVGEPATFRAEVDAGVLARWVEADGAISPAEQPRTYLPRSEGAFGVTLLVAAEGAEPVVVVHRAIARP